MTDRVFHVAHADEAVLRIRFVVQTSVAQHASNYHTLTIRHRRAAADAFAAQATGETVATFTTSTASTGRKLTAKSPVTLYESEQGLDLDEGDELVASLVATGSPAVLDDPTLKTLRNTR